MMINGDDVFVFHVPFGYFIDIPEMSMYWRWCFHLQYQFIREMKYGQRTLGTTAPDAD